jgi:hypothetical protein
MSTVCDTYAETPTPRGNNMQDNSGEKPPKKGRLFEVEDEGGEKDVLRPKDLTPAFSGLGNSTLRDSLSLPVAGTAGTLPDETESYQVSEPATVPGTPTTPRTLPEVFKLQAAETQDTVACTADLTVTHTPLPKESKDEATGEAAQTIENGDEEVEPPLKKQKKTRRTEQHRNPRS